MKKWINKNPLLFFVIINYLISWSFLYPCYQAILGTEEGQFPWLVLIGIPGGFGPSIAALITVRIAEGQAAVKNLLRRLTIWKVAFKWYLFVLIVPMFLYFLTVLIIPIFGFSLTDFDFPGGVKSIFPYLLLALPFGPLMEELGWRGYMLPKLLEKHSAAKATLIIGIVWTFWHLASFTFPGAAIPSEFAVNFFTIGLYLCYITSTSFIFTYVYLCTKGSVLLAILLHCSFNAVSNIIASFFPESFDDVAFIQTSYIIYFVLVSLLALFLFWRGRHTLRTNSDLS